MHFHLSIKIFKQEILFPANTTKARRNIYLVLSIAPASIVAAAAGADDISVKVEYKEPGRKNNKDCEKNEKDGANLISTRNVKDAEKCSHQSKR